MQPRSERYDDAVLQGGTPITQVEVIRPGGAEADQVLATYTAGVDGVVIDGAVTAEHQPVRRTLDLQLALTSSVDPGLLLPPNELRVKAGFTWPATLATSGIVAASSEAVPVGVFRITDRTRRRGGTVTIGGKDRMRKVSRSRFTTPYSILTATNIVTAIQALIDDRTGGVTWNVGTTGFTTPPVTYVFEDDPAEVAAGLAGSAGMEVFCDAEGVFVVRDVVDPAAATPVWAFAPGDYNTLLDVEETTTDEPGYNGVVASGESISEAAPVSATVWDTDPTSRTYYLGPYGQVPMGYASPLLTTTEQCTSAARARLRSVLGLTQAAPFSCIPHWALDLDDLVVLADTDTGVDGVYLLDQIVYPLGTGEMTVSPRQRLVQL